MSEKDYYAILEISKTASQSEIKKAYGKLGLIYNGDRFKCQKNPPSSECKIERSERKFCSDNCRKVYEVNMAKFNEITKAYQVLSDEQKRKEYDRGGSSSNNFNASASSNYSSSGSNGYKATDEFKKESFKEITRYNVMGIKEILNLKDEIKMEKYNKFAGDLSKEAENKINGMKTEEEITRYVKQTIDKFMNHVDYLKRTSFASEKKSTSSDSSSTKSARKDSGSSRPSSSSSSEGGASDYKSSDSTPEPKRYEEFTCEYCRYRVPNDDPRNPWVSSSFPGKKFCTKSCIDSHIRSKLSEQEHEETMRKIREDSDRSSEAHRKWMENSRKRQNMINEVFDDAHKKLEKENKEFRAKRGAKRLQDSKKWALNSMADWLRIYKLSEEVFTELGHSNWREEIGNCSNWEEIEDKYDYYLNMLKEKGKIKEQDDLENHWKDECIKDIEFYLNLYKVKDSSLNKKLGTDDWRKLIRDLSSESEAKNKKESLVSQIKQAKNSEEIEKIDQIQNSGRNSYHYQRSNTDDYDSIGKGIIAILGLGLVVGLIVWLVKRNK